MLSGRMCREVDMVHDAAAVLRLSGRMRREAEGGREADEAYRDALFVSRAK